MKAFLSIFFFFIVLNNCYLSQYQKIIGNNGVDEYSKTLAVDDANNVYIGATSNNDAWILKMNEQNTFWSKKITDNQGRKIEISKVIIVADTLFATGWYKSGTTIDGFIVIKLNKNDGSLYWIKKDVQSKTYFSSIAYSNGKLFLTGSKINGNSTNYDLKIICLFSSNGQLFWEKVDLGVVFQNFNNDYIDDLMSSSEMINNKMYITGRTYVNAGSTNMRSFIIGFDEDGLIFCNKYLLYDPTTAVSDKRYYGETIQFTSNLDSLIIGFVADDNCSGSCDDYKSGIIKTDLYGNIGFAKIYDITGVTKEFVSQVNITDNAYFLFGTSNFSLANPQDFVIKLDLDGNFMGGNLISSPTIIANSIILSPGVGGSSAFKNGLNYFISNTVNAIGDIILNVFDENLSAVNSCFTFEPISLTESLLNNESNDIILINKNLTVVLADENVITNDSYISSCTPITFDTLSSVSNNQTTMTISNVNFSDPLFSWSTSDTGNQAVFVGNELVVTITNPLNCCSYLDTFYLNNLNPCINPLQATITSLPNTVCGGFSQFCDYTGPSILINEINISPSQFNGNMYGVFDQPAAGEWIELFNPNWCDTIDISGYYFGSYNSNAAGVPASFGMGFVFPPNTIVPPLGFVVVRGANAPIPPIGTIDIIVDETDNRICVEGGLDVSRFWFQDFGSWFAFYDRNGVPQDAIKWGSPVLTDLDFRPCLNFNNPNPLVTSLPSFNEIGFGISLGNSSVGFTYVRIPDGGDWSAEIANEFSSYGSCNVSGGCQTLIGATSTCNGSASLTITNGQAPYLIVWNDVLAQNTTQADSLCAGIYQVTVTDANNCTQNFTIGIEDLFPTIEILTTNPSCLNNDGIIDINVSPLDNYTYNWSANSGVFNDTTTLLSNLSGGTYTLSIISPTCELDTNIQLNIPEQITDLILNLLNENCNSSDGSIEITSVVGGVPTYLYNFNNQGFSSSTLYSNLESGTYPISVVDVNGCNYSEQATISNASGPNDFTYTLQNETCSNQNAVIIITSISGGTPNYQYNFNNQGFTNDSIISNLSEGNYTLTISDAGSCTITEVISITNTSGPTAINFNVIDEICNNQNGQISILSVTGGTPNYIYNFNNQGFGPNMEFLNLSEGNYSFQVQDANGCIFNQNAINLSNQMNQITYDYSFLQPICSLSNGEIQITQISGGNSPYIINFNQTGFSDNQLFTNLNSNTYLIEIQDANSCLLQDSITLIADNSSAPYGFLATVKEPNCGELNGEINVNSILGGSPSFLYHINNSITNSNSIFTNLGVGEYQIQLIDINNCKYDSIVKIENDIGEERILIPNIFSPSNDFSNETWFISGECLMEMTCEIFNRWGNSIHKLETISEHWDGTTKGEKVKEGVYFYILNATFSSGRKEKFHGHITVVYQ
jgi:gliding motility-associated-like protein